MSFFFNFLLVLLLINSILVAQEESSLRINESSAQYCVATDDSVSTDFLEKPSFNWHDPITQLPADFYTFGKNVFDEKNISTLVGLTTLTILIVQMDHDLSYRMYDEYKRSESFHDFAKKTSYIGDGQVHFGLAALFGGAGLITKNNRALRTALQIIESEIVTGLTVQVLKRISGRESPQSASRPGGLFRFFPNMRDYNRNETKFYSFPSGHVSTSMAVLTVIAENYPEVKWIKPIGYSIIGMIGLGLMARGWHWLSDYPLAIAIGYTFGKLIASRNSDESIAEAKKSNLSFEPVMMNGLGIGLVYKF